MSAYNRPEYYSKYNKHATPSYAASTLSKLNLSDLHSSGNLQYHSREHIKTQIINEIQNINKTMIHNNVNISMKTLERAYHVPEGNDNSVIISYVLNF